MLYKGEKRRFARGENIGRRLNKNESLDAWRFASWENDAYGFDARRYFYITTADDRVALDK